MLLGFLFEAKSLPKLAFFYSRGKKVNLVTVTYQQRQKYIRVCSAYYYSRWTLKRKK